MGKTGGGILRVADADFLKILNAPEIAVLAHGPQIEAGDAKGLCTDLRIPTVEPPEK
jgi:hypothetical protein